MSQPLPAHRRSPLTGGWILVVVLLTLCIAGTWLTVSNYRSRVFSSDDAMVLLAQWPEPRLSVEFPPEQVNRIRPGMVARITVGKDPAILPGVVVSTDASSRPSVVIVRLTTDPVPLGPTPPAGQRPAGQRHELKAGTRCSVTIDTTIPLQESSPRAKPYGPRE